MIKVSVIIPVYHAAETIIRCIESLLSQTLADLEVILVDDHGNDTSLQQVEALLANHHRKMIFRFAETPQNLGPGEARNVGVRLAQGEFVAFLDSDDWVEPTMYEELYAVALAHSADMAYCNAFLDTINSKSRLLSNPQMPQGVVTDESRAFFLTHYAAYLWTFIYRRDFLLEHGISFPPERSSEDSYFIACNVLLANSIASVDNALYHYVVHAESLSQRRDENRYQQKIAVFAQLIDFAKAHQIYTRYQAELDFIYLKKAYLMAVFNYLINASKPDKKTVDEINLILWSQIPTYKSNRYYKNDFKVRLLVSFIIMMPRLAIACLPFFIRRSKLII